MQSLANAGAIIISDSTRNLVEGYFALRSLGPTRLKGLNKSVRIYEVAGLGPLRTRLERSAGRGLSSSSSGSSSWSPAGPSTLFVVARRLHGLHPRDDGPVRSRHVARERRDVHGLVPAPRPAGAVRPRRRGRPRPAPAVRQRPARAGLDRARTSTLVALGVGSILFDGLSQTQPCFDLFGAPGTLGKTLLLSASSGIVVAARAAGRAAVGVARDRGRPAADRRRATSSPTT